MAINLLPWREQERFDRRLKNQLYLLLFLSFFMVLIFQIRQLFVLDLEALKKQRGGLVSQFSKNNAAIDKHNDLIQLILFIHKLAVITPGKVFIQRISMRDNVIRLSLFAETLHELELFIQKINQEAGIHHIRIDGAATSTALLSEPEKNKFTLLLYLEKKEPLSL